MYEESRAHLGPENPWMHDLHLESSSLAQVSQESRHLLTGVRVVPNCDRVGTIRRTTKNVNTNFRII